MAVSVADSCSHLDILNLYSSNSFFVSLKIEMLKQCFYYFSVNGKIKL